MLCGQVCLCMLNDQRLLVHNYDDSASVIILQALSVIT